MTNDETQQSFPSLHEIDQPPTVTNSVNQQAIVDTIESSSTILNGNILDSTNQNFSYSDNLSTRSDIFGLFDDDDDEEDDDYQDLNEDEDIELENFDWIDWDDLPPVDDDFDLNQSKRGRKKYQKFEKPSVLPSIRPKSPTKQASSSSGNATVATVNMLNNVPLQSQPYQFPFPQILTTSLFPTANSSKTFNQFPIVPPTIFPPYDLMFPRGVNLTTNSSNNGTSGASLITSQSPPSPSSSTNNNTIPISSILSSQTIITDDQMKELYSQMQSHTQLLFYNYVLSSFNPEYKEHNKKIKNLITSYMNTRKEAVNNKMRKLLYLCNLSKDVKLTNLLDGTKIALKDNSFSSSSNESSSTEERSIDDWIKLLSTSILDVEGIESMNIFLDFDYSFFYINNQINWELFVKFLKPFKLFSNQSLLAEIQESIYYLNTTAERGLGSKRMVFTIPEDNLLLIGLKKHWKPGTTIKWEKIREDFVPNKSSKQLRVRYKNMIGKRAEFDFNPFKLFRSIAEEKNQQVGEVKKKEDNQDYSHLFESVKLFKVTSKLTKKELPVSYKDLSKIHTYVPRDNISSGSESDDQTKESGDKKRKKNDKLNPKKKKKPDSEEEPQSSSIEGVNLLTNEQITSPVLPIENPNLNDSSLSEVFLKPRDLDLSSSKILPIEDVGSIDSSSEDEDSEPHTEKDSEVFVNGTLYKFSYYEDKNMLLSLQNEGIKLGSILEDKDEDIINKIAIITEKPPEVIKARYRKILNLNTK